MMPDNPAIPTDAELLQQPLTEVEVAALLRFIAAETTAGMSVRRLAFERDALRQQLAEKDAEIERLRGWKAEALAVEDQWDMQAVGKLIGCKLGSGIHSQIQPAIERLQARVAELEAAIHEHNQDCESSCKARTTCDGFKSRRLQCPECPMDWTVEVPGLDAAMSAWQQGEGGLDAAIDAARGEGT